MGRSHDGLEVYKHQDGPKQPLPKEVRHAQRRPASTASERRSRVSRRSHAPAARRGSSQPCTVGSRGCAALALAESSLERALALAPETSDLQGASSKQDRRRPVPSKVRWLRALPLPWGPCDLAARVLPLPLSLLTPAPSAWPTCGRWHPEPPCTRFSRVPWLHQMCRFPWPPKIAPGYRLDAILACRCALLDQGCLASLGPRATETPRGRRAACDHVGLKEICSQGEAM
mmetsp:Transcript_94126/g.176927  ORF Transcript_94126/g.176927 Transcript_94126/m.176927 type:complete len:230 (-) Transcript_94126:4503-5192(-)